MSKGHTAHYQTPTMKTATQIFAAVVAGAALNVGLAATNLHPVNALITHTHGIETAGPITLPEVDTLAIAAGTVVDTAGMTGLPHIYLGANMAVGFAEGFYAE